MKVIITLVLISILVVPSFINLVFLAVGRTYDEAITLHERGIVSFIFTRIKIIMHRLVHRRHLEI
jgi:hypothetical protein